MPPMSHAAVPSTPQLQQRTGGGIAAAAAAARHLRAAGLSAGHRLEDGAHQANCSGRMGKRDGSEQTISECALKSWSAFNNQLLN